MSFQKREKGKIKTHQLLMLALKKKQTFYSFKENKKAGNSNHYTTMITNARYPTYKSNNNNSYSIIWNKQKIKHPIKESKSRERRDSHRRRIRGILHLSIQERVGVWIELNIIRKIWALLLQMFISWLKVLQTHYIYIYTTDCKLCAVFAANKANGTYNTFRRLATLNKRDERERKHMFL